MSRIAKAPIQVPAGVEIDIKGEEVKVKGPKGNLALKLHPSVSLNKDDDSYVVSAASDADIAMAGTYRSLKGKLKACSKASASSSVFAVVVMVMSMPRITSIWS